MLEEYLRHYVTTTQTNWLELHEPAQLSYNLHRSSTTRMSPFEVAIGFQPRTPLNVLASEQPRRSLSHTACEFAKTRQDLLDEAPNSLEKASKHMKKYADQGTRPLEFELFPRTIL